MLPIRAIVLVLFSLAVYPAEAAQSCDQISAQAGVSLEIGEYFKLTSDCLAGACVVKVVSDGQTVFEETRSDPSLCIRQSETELLGRSAGCAVSMATITLSLEAAGQPYEDIVQVDVVNNPQSGTGKCPGFEWPAVMGAEVGLGTRTLFVKQARVTVYRRSP